MNQIERWHGVLSASDHGEFQQLADGLAALKSELLGPDPDADAIGSVLTRLGKQTTAAATHAEHDAVGAAVERLGHLLLHAGHALRGPRPVPRTT